LSENFAVCLPSEAYACREKSHKYWRRFSRFGVLNALLTANLCENLAKLWVNHMFFCLKPGFFPSCAWEHSALGSTLAGSPCGPQTTPWLHVRSILTGVIDACLCRGNVLMSKRQTYVAKHICGAPHIPGDMQKYPPWHAASGRGPEQGLEG
jgi:hypothetical protein